MFNLGDLDAFLQVVMTLEAHLLIRLEEELLIIRGVRGMARGAFSIFDGLMFYFGGFDILLNVLVAGEAECLAGLDEHLWIWRPVRIMTGIAFTILDGLVFDLGRNYGLSEFLVLVTIGAHLEHRALHLHGVAGFVALRTLLVFVWRMGVEDDLYHGVRLDGGWSSIQRQAVLVISDCRRIGVRAAGHSIEEKRENVLFGLGAARA
jgi:hypothetical protein